METQITNPSSMSVFITGATNALGRVVTRRLVAAGHRVTGATDDSAGAAQVRADGGLERGEVGAFAVIDQRDRSGRVLGFLFVHVALLQGRGEGY